MENGILRKRTIILLSVLFLGIGFALLTTDLRILGNTTVSRNNWNIYFDNVAITEGSVSASVNPTTTGKTTTSLNFTVNLDEPGDFYEFTVDAVNDGTLDAVIKNVNMTSLDSNTSKYLTYTATYADGTSIEEDNILTRKTTVTYKVRVEFKKDIVAADLDENGINLELSFGVKYEQYFPEESNFSKLIKSNAVSDRNLDLSLGASESNEKGLYVIESTKNNFYPIYYYHGDVENNNAMFAGYCWKIVRTTETGGTKLIYNGLPKNTYLEYQKLDQNSYVNLENSQTYPFEFNDENDTWNNGNQTDGQESIITFSIKESGNYKLNYNVSSSYEWAWGVQAYFYKDGIQIGYYDDMNNNNDSIYLENITTSNEFSIKYINYSDESTFSFNIEKGIGESVIGCINKTGDETQISESAFNTGEKSLAYNGYMYGTIYEGSSKRLNTSNDNYLYGNSFTYSNGTYTLTNTATSPNYNRHYTCFNTTGSCENIYYIYYMRGNPANYITLTGGKSVEDAINEMETNTTNSNIKTTLDNWFNNTFKSFFTSRSKNYNNYLEDTIWCNDRSSSTHGYDGSNGWNPNGGNYSNPLWHASWERRSEGTPTLECPNKNDSFTVKESATGNGALTYPVGLLTNDEIIFAGGESYSYNSYYLSNGKTWWTMTPDIFYSVENGGFYVDNNGHVNIDYGYLVAERGVRPSISIKPGVEIAAGGNGTAVSPYVFVVE